MRGVSIPVVIGAVAVVLGGALYAASLRPAQAPTRELTWVVTHNPVSVFDKAKVVFVDEFNKDSDIKISVKLLGPDDFKTSANRLMTEDAFAMMKKGEAQIATLSLPSLAQQVPETAVFSLPYLFKNDDTVEAVFTGSIGRGILDAITAHYPVHALDFTFSGGWLVIQSNTHTFTKPSDFVGAHLTGTTKGSAKVLGTLGANAEPVDLVTTSNQELNQNLDKYDGVETVLTRLHRSDSPKYITVTNHALYTTTIVVDNDFYASLSPRDQRALQRAADAASRTERADSRELARTNKEDLVQRGTQMIELTDAQRAALAAHMDAAYTVFDSKSTDGSTLVDEIRALK